MNKSSFFIVGKHPVLEALKNPKRKVLRIFLTEEAKKIVHRDSPRNNLLKDLKIFGFMDLTQILTKILQK